MGLFMEQTFDKKREVNSFLQAYIVCIPLLNYFIGEIIGDGAMIVNIMVCASIFLFNNFSGSLFSINKKLFMFIIIVSGWYIVSVFLGVSSLSCVEFLYYFIFASLVSTQNFDYKKVVLYVVLFSFLVIPFGKSIFFDDITNYYSNSSVSLALSYALLPLIIAGITHFYYYRDDAKWYTKVCYLVDIFLIIQLFIKGNRGLVLSLFIAIALIAVKGKNNAKESKTIVRIILLIILMVIVLLNLNFILLTLSSSLNRFGLSANFLEKMSRLQASNSIFNGRESIYGYVFSNVWDSPIWGHGISSIESFSNGEIFYPHNFILQLLFDGGLVLFVLFIVVLLKQLRKMMVNVGNANESVYLLFLFLCTVPKMLFSTDMWTNAAFFMMISYTIISNRNTLKMNMENTL